jgi:signal transduction histidine kinase
VEPVVDAVRPAADAKTIQIKVIIDPAANHLRAEAGRLQQVIWNLL